MSTDSLHVFNSVVWYVKSLDMGTTDEQIRAMDYDDIRSYLSDLKRWYEDVNPSIEQAWDMASAVRKGRS